MADWLQAVLTGLFTGIGVSVAEWIKIKYLHPNLDKINNKLLEEKKQE